MVSGIIARLKSFQPTDTADDWDAVLRQTAYQTPDSFYVPNALALLAEFNMPILFGDEFIPFKPLGLTQEDRVISDLLTVPNPVKQATTTLYFQSKESGVMINVSVFNLDGIELMQKQITASIGENTVEIDVSSWVNGVYVVVAEASGSESAIIKDKIMVLR